MLVVIDPAVDDPDFLVGGALPGAKATVLDQRQDAIAQITSLLYDDREDRTHLFNSIHLIAPGSPGILHFSSGDFGLKTLQRYVDKIQTWFTSESLAATPQAAMPQLLLYGRRVGAGQSGTELMDTLSWLTGADVIAAKNGDRWPNVNGKQAELAFPPSVLQSYQGTFSA